MTDKIKELEEALRINEQITEALRLNFLGAYTALKQLQLMADGKARAHVEKALTDTAQAGREAEARVRAPWIKCSERMPHIGQRVILKSNGVVQHYMPILDQGDANSFGGGSESFWDFEETMDGDYPLVNFESDEWMPIPNRLRNGGSDGE